MISFTIDDTKTCMSKLLKDDVFDNFLCVSFELIHRFKVEVDGQLRQDFLDSDEKETMENLSHIYWKDFRPYAFDLIRGNKTPTSFKIIFTLTPTAVSATLERAKFTNPEFISGFSFTLSFENKAMKVITGTNYSGFTMDKSAENYFDQTIIRFFKKQNIGLLLALN